MLTCGDLGIVLVGALKPDDWGAQCGSSLDQAEEARRHRGNAAPGAHSSCQRYTICQHQSVSEQASIMIFPRAREPDPASMHTSPRCAGARRTHGPAQAVPATPVASERLKRAAAARGGMRPLVSSPSVSAAAVSSIMSEAPRCAMAFSFDMITTSLPPHTCAVRGEACSDT